MAIFTGVERVVACFHIDAVDVGASYEGIAFDDIHALGNDQGEQIAASSKRFVLDFVDGGRHLYSGQRGASCESLGADALEPSEVLKFVELLHLGISGEGIIKTEHDAGFLIAEFSVFIAVPIGDADRFGCVIGEGDEVIGLEFGMQAYDGMLVERIAVCGGAVLSVGIED